MANESDCWSTQCLQIINTLKLTVVNFRRLSIKMSKSKVPLLFATSLNIRETSFFNWRKVRPDREMSFRESSVWESACPGNDCLSWKLCFCPGNVCPGKCPSGKRRSGKRLVRETSVREMSCPGNDRLPWWPHEDKDYRYHCTLVVLWELKVSRVFTVSILCWIRWIIGCWMHRSHWKDGEDNYYFFYRISLLMVMKYCIC